jgi:hypothetical protein
MTISNFWFNHIDLIINHQYIPSACRDAANSHEAPRLLIGLKGLELVGRSESRYRHVRSRV